MPKKPKEQKIMGWPQWILIGYMILGILHDVSKQGTPRPDYCGVSTIINAALFVGLLYCGGFFG